MRQRRAQLLTRFVSFPFAPARQSLGQGLCAQLDEVTQQPHQSRELILLLVSSRVDDVLAQTLNPNVAIVQIAERGLNARDPFRIARNRSAPALLKEFDRITQSFRGDAHVVQRLDLERIEQTIAQRFKLFQPVQNDLLRHCQKRDCRRSGTRRSSVTESRNKLRLQLLQLTRLENRLQLLARVLAKLFPPLKKRLESGRERRRSAGHHLLQRRNRNVLIAHFPKRIRAVAQLLQRGRERTFAQVRHEISQRAAQPSRSNTHRVDAFRVAPIQCRLLKTTQLVEPGE